MIISLVVTVPKLKIVAVPEPDERSPADLTRYAFVDGLAGKLVQLVVPEGMVVSNTHDAALVPPAR
jgi:hypothetical protein